MTDPAASTKRKEGVLEDPKSSKRLKTPAATPSNDPEEASSQAHILYKKIFACIALDYFNNNNDTKFELVVDETLYSDPSTDISLNLIHIGFNAKEDSSINKFFAELQYVHNLGLAVTTCKNLGGGGYRAGFVDNSTPESPAMPADDEDSSMGFDLDKELVKENKGWGPESPDYPYGDIDENTKRETHRGKCMEAANDALNYYNKKNGTKFEVLENDIMDYKSIIYSAGNYYVHCFFRAMEDSSINDFFAEMDSVDTFTPITVTTCKILKVGETKIGCRYCRFLHPVYGYYLACSASSAMSYDDSGEDYVFVDSPFHEQPLPHTDP